MQLYFPNIKTIPGCVSMFDYLTASNETDDDNVIFNSDLYLENFDGHDGRTSYPLDITPLDQAELHNFLGYVVQNFSYANAQVFQDLYVLWKLKEKTNGTFVEIGTGFPSGGNNTYILEYKMKWKGVLVEPGKFFEKLITDERTSPLENKAIYPTSNVDVVLTVGGGFHHGGCIEACHIPKPEEDNSNVEELQEQKVKTISILDLFKTHKIDRDFDYLSYDTIGSSMDVEVLEQMLNNNFRPHVISYGHNYKPVRLEVKTLLEQNGYIRQFDFISKWDDWYYLTPTTNQL